jgi:hypothetical protein
MFGKNTRVSPLELQKQFLIAESELNRAQLAGDLAESIARVRAVTHRVREFGSVASSAALLVVSLADFRRGKAADGGRKRSWLQSILKGAGLISTLWLAYNAKGRERVGIDPPQHPVG